MSATTALGFAFDNTFAEELEGLYRPAKAAGFTAPKLLKLNGELARELGLDVDAFTEDDAAQVFAGNVVPKGAAPLAQAYAGHQFGGFSAQLGDGRALLLGEIIDVHDRRRDLQLKGSGPTPFSRGGDGKAAVGPVLREYLIGEAMFALGVPTTRALAAVATGEPVYREQPLPGAVLARVASSHIRVGTFEYFSARREEDELRRLADYTVGRHYPQHVAADNRYLELLLSVCSAQAELVARWMHIGFIHGVMNTDNVTVSGETIDYGPCAFMDTYDPETVFSSIDRHGRYAFGEQPKITLWNLSRFAEALLPLLANDQDDAISLAEQALQSYLPQYQAAWLKGMSAKLGLSGTEDSDLKLVEAFLGLLEKQRVDFTMGFRALSAAARGDASPIEALLADRPPLDAWLKSWRTRLDRGSQSPSAAADAMDNVNPLYVPRNHKTEEALAAATDDGDLALFDALLDVVTAPFTEKPGMLEYTRPAPDDFGPYRTFCGT